jgi:hypothetical protein
MVDAANLATGNGLRRFASRQSLRTEEADGSDVFGEEEPAGELRSASPLDTPSPATPSAALVAQGKVGC